MLQGIFLTLLMVFPLSSYAVSGGRSAKVKRINEITSVALNAVGQDERVFDARTFAVRIQYEESRVGRKYTTDEIRQQVRQVVHRHFAWRPRCFTGSMRVLTPQGYTEIQKLNAGDEVYSWDERAESLILNTVTEVLVADSVPYGRLMDVCPLGRPIEVTADHPFYSPTEKDYFPLSSLMSEHRLLKVGHNCESELIARGVYEPDVGQTRVYSLQLQGEHGNFILEGLVVQNKPFVSETSTSKSDFEL